MSEAAPAYAAVSAYSLPSNESNDWLHAGFIHDKFSAHCQRAQGRPFLRTGIRPAVGHRVELTMILSSTHRGQMPFRLSGEVVDDCVASVSTVTQLCTEGMRSAKEDTAAYRRTVSNDDSAFSSLDTSHHPKIPAWHPSTSAEDVGINGGSVALAHMVRYLILQQHKNLDIAPEHLTSAWKAMSDEKKEQVSNAIVKKLGAFHGQKVVCEGRLNFDYDMRRGTEEGPWVDGIPFDGRDVWQFTLVADDSLENLWRADPSSFINLGPAHRPRCWPWSNENGLPYERMGNDAPVRGQGPKGAISVHICVGPHGCSGKDHPHNYQAQAA